MLFTIVIIFVVFLPLCLFFSHYNTPKTKNKPTIQKTKQQQLSTMERMPKHFTDAAGSDSKLMTHLYDDATTILESLERGCSLNGQSFWLMFYQLPVYFCFPLGSGNCLGRIEQSTKSVSWWSYKTVMERVAHFGDGLYHLLGGVEMLAGRSEPACIGIYSVNVPEYIIAEYGCYWHSLVVVPIYDTLGPNACSYISNQGMF